MTRSWCDSRWLALLTLALGITLAPSPALPAQDHIVTSADLHQAAKSAAQTRQQNLDKVENFLSEPRVVEALNHARIDDAKIKKAVPTLTDDELARLAARTDKYHHDVAAGSLNNEQITYIIIALVTAVIIIIIFEA